MYFKRIKELRIENKETQEGIAKALKVQQSSYSRWENGKAIIPFERLIDLCNYYKVSIDYILSISNTKKSTHKKKTINKNVIGQNIKQIRKMNNVSQLELALLLKTTQSTVSAFENGKVLILTIFIYKIAKKYKISIDKISENDNSI